MKTKRILVISVLLVGIVSYMCPLEAGQSTSSKEKTSYKEVDKIRDVSMHEGTIKRIVARIVIPSGRSEKDVRATLKKAAIEIGKREKAKATDVKGYRTQDKTRTGVYTVGHAIYAPNGEWRDAASDAPMAVTVEVSKNSLYFKSKKTVEKKDRTLKTKNGESIEISSMRDKWGKKYIIAKIPSGTPAKLLNTHKTPLTPEMVFVRYQVSIKWKGKEIKGWVHEEDLN